MITTLHIKNIGIIDDLSVDLENGLNVFTGETGAGKTLIIDAINLICGGRFSKELIRKGENYCFVELNLYLPNHHESIENSIIISREIHTNGRNSCKINGRLVTVNELKGFMSNIIDIHGQNDNQQLLNTSSHIFYLDNLAGENFSNILEKYRILYKRFCRINIKLKENLGDEKEKQRKLDLLQYQFNEINDANLKIGEEETLRDKSLLFENAEKIANSLNEAITYSDKSVDLINKAIKSVEKISSLDEKFDRKLSELKSFYYEIDEFNRALSYMNNSIDFNASERDMIEERLDVITSLKRKYGNSIQEILEFKNEIEKEITRINNLEELNNNLRAELIKIENQMDDLVLKIHNKRKEVACLLNKKINKELIDLELKNARFIAKVEKNSLFDNNGKDSVQFFISTNIGEDAKELNKIASGGEMSRIMLAIKTVLANTDNVPIMIFDEIDTGISGKAAKVVSKKLKVLGEKHQVICITHQPSIAASGNYNYLISKSTSNLRTHTKIKKLNEYEIIHEIARISNGDITETALKHAIELRKLA